MSFDDKKGAFTPKNREIDIEKNAQIAWKSYSLLPSDEQKKNILQYHLNRINSNQNISIEDVDYNTFYDIYRDKDTIDRAKEAEERKKQNRDQLNQEFLCDNSESNSQSAKDVCEVCDEQKVKCLCHVAITSPLREKEYFWKAGSEGELANQPLIIGVHSNEKDYKPFKLNFKILGSACQGKKGPFPKKCTNLYYYEKDVNDKVIGSIVQEGQSGDLLLKFHADYLDKDKKLSPYYLIPNTKHNEDPSLSPFKSIKHGEPLYLKEFKFAAAASKKADLPQAPLQIDLDSKDGSSLITFLQRALSFGLLSKFDYMPASAFHVGILECKDADMNMVKDNNILSYHEFDQAKADVYVMPNYELTHKFSLKLGTLSGEFTVAKLLKALTNIGFSIDLSEKFNGKQGGKATFEVSNPMELLKKVFTQNYAMISILIEALEAAPKFIEDAFPSEIEGKVTNKALLDKVVTFTGVSMPNISLSGSSKMNINKDFEIERANAKLSADPLLGGNIKLNLAALLINKIKLATIIYGGLKQVERINDYTNKVRIDISTDKDFMSTLSQEEKLDRERATAELRLILYGQLLIKPKLKLSIDILTSNAEEIKYSLNTSDALTVDLEFSAGISFKGRVYRFYGGFDASITVSTGFKYGFKDYPRKTSSGKAYTESVDFGYFNGLTATWKVEVYGGAKIGNIETEEQSKWEADKTPQKSSEFDYMMAENERNSLQRSHDLHEKYMNEELKALQEKRNKEPLIGGRMVTQQDRDQIKKTADMYFPDNERYEALNQQLNFYNGNQHIFEEIKSINMELNCSTSFNEQDKLLKRRFDLMKQVNTGVIDHGLVFKPNDYHLWDEEMEMDARDYYINSLNDRIKQLENERDYAFVPNDKEALKRDADKRTLQDRIKKDNISRIEKEKQSIQDMDDVGRKALFGPRLLGARSLSEKERNELLTELKG